MANQIIEILDAICEAEASAKSSINLTPSENILSPLSRLPFLLDSYSRYFLDDLRIFGRWCFPSGKSPGEIEQNILIPLLQEMTGAKYVNVKPISGMNCMTIALAGLSRPGDTIFTVPVDKGGHASTANVAERMALQVNDIPFVNDYDINYECLGNMLADLKPAIIYIDQATFLFPIDTTLIRKLVDKISPKTVIHFDTSHANGLILGGAIANPLTQGAHCFGGSTHKTLPGPHKGFLVTNDEDIHLKLQVASDSFVSHHHTASVLSLAITLIEMKLCHGNEYARKTVENAKCLALYLDEADFYVAGRERGYTECHQVLTHPKSSEDSTLNLVGTLLQQGIYINNFNRLPGINRNGFRLSTAEITRMGAGPEEIRDLANIIVGSQNLSQVNELNPKLMMLKEKLAKPHFCFGFQDVKDSLSVKGIRELSSALFDYL